MGQTPKTQEVGQEKAVGTSKDLCPFLTAGFSLANNGKRRLVRCVREDCALFINHDTNLGKSWGCAFTILALQSLTD